ncbi:ABC transporter substrate-binding protein [Carboxydothermus pertinax]|uniref:ABC transporter substrate-binding protein n=1 Tax=Carboxydothermus pertinax TaxID=870242 RepID=A0A1L8CT52_9THEO|nr:ABC transporter substrate-binding protein [Carboxydothermus pertinax]GAV22024.1 ABC transporter substrate-binding protein [Carboxydothermus pertinax]
MAKKSWMVFLAIALIMLVAVTPLWAGQSKGITVKDSKGNVFTFKSYPKRIVSLAPSNTEILFALGLDKNIVGVTNFCDYPAAAKKKAKVGDAFNVNVEKIVSLKPDLVVAQDTISPDAIKKLQNLKVKVFVLKEPKNFNDILNNIKLVGKATGKYSKAVSITNNMQSRLNKLTAKLKKYNKPSVLVEIDYTYGLYVAGPNTFVNDILVKAGGKNVITSGSWVSLSDEKLLTLNPDYILLADTAYLKPDQHPYKRELWQGLRAVREKRVIDSIDPNLIVRPGPRSIDGVEKLAKALHPGLK